MNPIHWFVNFVIRVYTRITCRIDAPDLQQKVPMQGPLIVITNHTGQIEVPLLFAHLQPRKMTGWAKIETWDNWFLNWVFNLWQIIPVRRGEADMNALKKALQALKDGCIFGLAPEGTRNKTGRLRRALPGAVIVAFHSGAPILPIVHWGGEKYLSNLKRFKRTDFHIRVGEPFKINTNGVKVTGEIRQEIVDDMMYRLASMLPEEYRGEYSDLGKATGKYIKPT
ncbi:MAG: 1-acyl-sn-glycerol-3-phosphate acyltransferase [Chloroflexi bacterium]|nr:1-acyl-sn-glycerol-3-phosphate acyltransferase [Chloroflexota bacterium]